MYSIDLSKQSGIIFGIANDRSIAWSIFQILHQAGARLSIAYQNERLKSRIERLVQGMGDIPLLECDVNNDEAVESTFQTINREFGSLNILVHSIAYAQKEDLGGKFSLTERSGFTSALETSAYSFIKLAKHAAPLMEKSGGSIITITFQASQRVFPGYNIMGTAKAALEHEMRQLAAEYGESNIRVNAVSPGPLETLAARGIPGFVDMKKIHAQKAPLKRNITHNEVAKTALYLCSDLSSGVTGTVIPVDAGYHIMAP